MAYAGRLRFRRGLAPLRASGPSSMRRSPVDGDSMMTARFSANAIRFAVLLLGLALTPAPKAQENAAASDVKAQVQIDNFTFSPAEITIAPGTALTWINRDDIPHAVAAATKSFRSKAMETDQTYSFTFTTSGVYDYFCSLHPQMRGKVIVK
jgi:amicyanin